MTDKSHGRWLSFGKIRFSNSELHYRQIGSIVPFYITVTVNGEYRREEPAYIAKLLSSVIFNLKLIVPGRDRRETLMLCYSPEYEVDERM